MRIFFNWCVKRRYITENPTAGLSTHAKATRSRVRTDAELHTIWNACESEDVPTHYGSIVQLLGDRTAARRNCRASWGVDRFRCDHASEDHYQERKGAFLSDSADGAIDHHQGTCGERTIRDPLTVPFSPRGKRHDKFQRLVEGQGSARQSKRRDRLDAARPSQNVCDRARRDGRRTARD